MDPVVSRKMQRTLEPVHGMIYFVPEAQERYDALGLDGARMGYFASRSAAMGPVPARVVIAMFFNFYPPLVEAAIPEAWRRADPADILAARLDAADAALRRLLGDGVDSPEMKEAADLARRATDGCHPEGRPLYAAHAELPWPDAPHLVLWHAQTLLREFRGDGHIAALVAEDVTGVEALLVHEATGDLAPGVLQPTRAWPDEDWAAARRGLVERGWLDQDGALTDAGRTSRAWVEDTTDRLMLPCWRRLGEEDCTRLRELVRPFSRAISSAVFSNT